MCFVLDNKAWKIIDGFKNMLYVDLNDDHFIYSIFPLNVKRERQLTHLNIIRMTKIHNRVLYAPNTMYWIIVGIHFAHQ